MAELSELNGDSPCDGCEPYDRCADEHLACSRFTVFVHRGIISPIHSVPTAAIYKGHFPDDATARYVPRGLPKYRGAKGQEGSAGPVKHPWNRDTQLKKGTPCSDLNADQADTTSTTSLK